MNNWIKVAEMLDLKLNEEFYVRNTGVDEHNKARYKITERGLLTYNTIQDMWISTGCTLSLLTLLITGELEVVKLPWKPKDGETYYTVDNYNGLFVSKNVWVKDIVDYALLKEGLVFKTIKEAEEKGIPIAKRLIEEFENGRA